MWSVYLQLCAALALGVYFGDKISVGDTIIFIIGIILTSGLRKLAIKKFFSMNTVVILMVAAGIISYHYAVSESSRSAYRFQDKYVTMLGKVTDLPRIEKDYNVYLVDVRLIHYLDENQEVRERVRVTTKDVLKFGDSVKIEGFLKPFSKKLNGGDYDVGRSYKAKGIYFSTYSDDIVLTDTEFKIYSPSYFATWVKSLMSDRIYENYEGDKAAVIRAVLTGYKDAFSEEFEEVLYESNTMRLFYPAYMHISFLLMLAGLLSEYVKKDKRDKLLIVLLALYAVFNFNSHYIVKSAMVIAAFAYSKYKIGFGNYIDVLSLVVGITLLINPLIGYETGFVLSVTANLVIYYFTPIVSARLKRIKSFKVKRLLSLWIAMGIGMLPMQAYYFNFTTPYAFLLNLIYAPLLGVLWGITPLKMFFMPILGNLNPFSYTVDGIIFFIMNIPKLVGHLPFYSVPLPRPDILTIAVFYIGLYLLRQGMLGRIKNDFSSQVAGAVIIGFLVTGIGNFSMKLNDVEIDFVNVGQGDGAVLSIPFRETIIIDGGGNSEFSSYDYGKEVFLPYLRREGHHRIDLAVVSHYHSDHCLGVIAAMKKLTVKEVLIPDCLADNEYRIEIEQIAKDKNIKVSYYKAGAKLCFNSGLMMDIISPDDKDLLSIDENDTSFGIRVSYGDFSALFVGDLTSNIEEKHKGEWGKSNLLKVGHHGSASSSGETFIDEVSPDVAVISVGLGNVYGLPNNDVIRRFMKRKIPIYRTDMHGDITVFADKSGRYRMNTFLED